METPNNFQLIYKCTIEPTGRLISNLKPINIDWYSPFTVEQIDATYTKEPEIAITMSQSEYERFISHWNQYMTIIEASQINPMVRDQYHQLITFATLIK
jgi:hypothetical protein